MMPMPPSVEEQPKGYSVRFIGPEGQWLEFVLPHECFGRVTVSFDLLADHTSVSIDDIVMI